MAFTARANIVRPHEPHADSHRHTWFTATGSSRNVQRGLQTVQNAKVRGTYLGAQQPTYEVERRGLTRLLNRTTRSSPPPAREDDATSTFYTAQTRGTHKLSHLPTPTHAQPDHLLTSTNATSAPFVDQPAPGNTFLNAPAHHRTQQAAPAPEALGHRARFRTTFSDGTQRSKSNELFSRQERQTEEQRVRQRLRGRLRENLNLPLQSWEKRAAPEISR